MVLRHEDETGRAARLATGPASAATSANVAAESEVRSTDADLTLAEWAKRKSSDAVSRRLSVGVWASFLTFVLAFPGAILAGSMFPTQAALWITLFLIMLCGGFGAGILCVGALIWRTLSASSGQPMPAQEGVRAIGPLLDRSLTDYRNRDLITSRLTELLPQLEPQDAGVLDRRHYEMLNEYLHQVVISSQPSARRAYTGQKPYLMAVLAAYSRVGDARALRDVRRLAAGKSAAAIRDTEIAQAAERCIPHLERVATGVREQETLLRGAQPAGGEGSLLRAAEGGPTETGETLLRAERDIM
jgi:hypothetical protein